MVGASPIRQSRTLEASDASFGELWTVAWLVAMVVTCLLLACATLKMFLCACETGALLQPWRRSDLAAALLIASSW